MRPRSPNMPAEQAETASRRLACPDFSELILADQLTRRQAKSAPLRARAAAGGLSRPAAALACAERGKR
jgi:hypothetical protein